MDLKARCMHFYKISDVTSVPQPTLVRYSPNYEELRNVSWLSGPQLWIPIDWLVGPSY